MLFLRLPLEQIKVTQPFGTNWVDFYKDLGLKGHPGIDFVAYEGCPVYACHGGGITQARFDNSAGNFVEITDKIAGNFYKTQYLHLKTISVAVGELISEGRIIGYADNTGKYTVGSHLHLTLKMLASDGHDVLNRDNGYDGAIDPSPYFDSTYTGIRIKNKDWAEPRAYHRYYQLRQSIKNEWRTVWELAKIFKRLPKNIEINARLYGNWEIESIKNPAMYELWSQLTSEEYKKGKKLYE